MTVVPRLTLALATPAEGLAIDRAAWGDTAVRLPAEWAGRRFRNLLTGARLEVAGDVPRLALWEVLHTCPVALLWAVPASDGR